MKVIDLSHFIEEGMPVFPGTESPELKEICTISNDGFSEKLLSMSSHAGTHIDAPAHMLDGGLCLDEFPADHFTGKAFVLNCRLIGRDITIEHLPDESILKEVSFLLLNTGWDKKWGSPQYFEGFPALSEEAAEYLAGFGLKGLGTDALSVDLMESETFIVHRTLLKKNMVMIENLTGLDKLEDIVMISVFPLKIKHADGSPVRAVAFSGLD